MVYQNTDCEDEKSNVKLRNWFYENFKIKLNCRYVFQKACVK